MLLISKFLCFNYKYLSRNNSYLNYKNSKTKINFKNLKKFTNLSENIKLTVIDINGKCGIGKLDNDSRMISSIPLNKNLYVNFGDILKTTKQSFKNDNSNIKILKRNKFTCGKIVFNEIGSKSGRLVHMNNINQTIANIPIIDKNIKFDKDCLYVGIIDSFQIENKIPNALLSYNLGYLKCPLTQLKAHLMYCGLNYHIICDMDTNYNDYNPQLQWEPNLNDIINRRNFLDDLILTIDPESASDFDDALSIKKCDDNSYEIGVHIADVTYFVKPESKIEKNAKKLCSSVYGNAKTFHMLPEILSKEKCSLKPGQTRLTFSLILKYSPEGEYINMWIGKGYIRSSCRLTYEQAEKILRNKDNKENEENIKIYNNFKWSQVVDVVVNLNKISDKILKNKIKQGRYSMSNQKLEFEMDYKTYKPKNIFLSKQLESHKLVETFMCAANEAVAKFLNDKLIDGGTLLRRHSSNKSLSSKLKICQTLGISLNLANLNFNEFLQNIPNTNSNIKLLIMNFLIQNTEKSIYLPFNNKENYFHSGLASSLYTHFTSPIRRYADIIVHRQLEHVLSNNYTFNKQEIKNFENISNNLNINEMQISILESIDKKYNLNLYIKNSNNNLNNHSNNHLNNLIGGCTSTIPILTGESKLFYPDIGMYVKTKLLPNYNIKFLKSIKANIIPTKFPQYIMAQQI